MAGAAVRVCVATEQGKSGEIVIEEEVLRPINFAVAVVACQPLSAVVGIVLRVAGVAAIAEGDLEYRLNVAKLTLELAMRAIQRMAGIDRMVEVNCSPLGRSVTIDAAESEVLVVSIVVRMAGNALRTESVCEGVFAVTAAAGLLRVRSGKRERSVSRVVEARIQPAARIVAGLAVLSAPSIVGVIGCVASETRRWRIAKRPVGVAVETLRFAVTADKRVAGRIVIEFDLLPTVRVVAVAAFFAEETLMRVFRCMTGKTVGRGVSVFLIGLVTASARRRCMSAEQNEIRVVVIEPGFVEPDDVGISAFMIGIPRSVQRCSKSGLRSLSFRS